MRVPEQHPIPRERTAFYVVFGFVLGTIFLALAWVALGWYGW